MADTTTLASAIDEFWTNEALPTFRKYVIIPCISRSYVSNEPNWRKPLEAASQLVRDWITGISALEPTIYCSPEGGPEAPPPVVLVHIPGTAGAGAGSVLTYGHLDKQAVGAPDTWASTWTEPAGAAHHGPFVPNVADDHLYGRGTSDDGFATFTMITTLAAMQQLGMPYPDVNIIIDFDEESGSENLQPALTSEQFMSVIGQPRLAIELDSSIGSYDRLWAGTSARGTITGTLTVEMLTTDVHSGDGGGVVPNPVNIVRLLLDQVHDSATGKVIVPGFQVKVPPKNFAEAEEQVRLLGESIVDDYPWWDGVAHPYSEPDLLGSQLAKTWRAAFAITGQAGLPSLANASNVILDTYQCQLSMRMPPSIDVDQAQEILQITLEGAQNFGAKVTYDYEGAPIGAGWVEEARTAWFEKAIVDASQAVFGESVGPYSDGGTIPVLNLISSLYGEGQQTPPVQILATGCAGPGNNEHGANENLNMAYARQLAAALALTIGTSVDASG